MADVVVVQTNVSLLVYVAVGLVIPLLVDLITKRMAGSALKAVILLALSLISAVLVEFFANLQQGYNDFDWKTALWGAVTTFIAAVASYFGFTKPVGLSGANGAIQRHLPGGLGSAHPADPAPEAQL